MKTTPFLSSILLCEVAFLSVAAPPGDFAERVAPLRRLSGAVPVARKSLEGLWQLRSSAPTEHRETFKEAVAIEQALSGYAEVVRQRMRKLEDLGNAMAGLNYAYTTLKTKDTESGDKTDYSSQLYNAYVLAGKYGVSIGWTGFKNDTMQATRRQILNAQNAVQYAIDKEDNDLKQDTVSLNSYVSKRDNSFSTASKIVKKALDASASTIGNIG